MTDQPSSAYLADYDLTDYTYGILRRCQAGPLWWQELKRDYGAPQSARRLKARGLLDGPASQENINSRPFNLSAGGHELLARLDRGLRTPGYLRPGRVRILKILATGYCSDRDLLDAGCYHMSIYSLRDVGYIRANGDGEAKMWHITALGLEALEEWRAA